MENAESLISLRFSIFLSTVCYDCRLEFDGHISHPENRLAINANQTWFPCTDEHEFLSLRHFL